MIKLKILNCDKTQQLTLWQTQNSNCDKNPNSYCDKTKKLKWWQNSNRDITKKIISKNFKTKITKQTQKLKWWYYWKHLCIYYKNQELKWWQNSRTQMVTKLKNSNCDKTRELKLWQNYLGPPVTLGLTWTPITFCFKQYHGPLVTLLISCKWFDVCIVQGKTVFEIIETIVWFNIKRAYMFYRIFVWGFCHVSIKNVKSYFFLQTCIEKNVTVTPFPPCYAIQISTELFHLEVETVMVKLFRCVIQSHLKRPESSGK